MESTNEQTFSTDAFKEKLTSPLLALSLPVDEVNAFASEIVDVYVRPQRPSGRRELVFNNVVIRNDDLQVMDTLWKTLPSIIAAGLYTDKALVAAIAGLVVGVARMGYGLRKKSAVLSGDNIALLLVLKQSPIGVTAQELTDRLNAARLVREYSVSDIEGRLTELTRVALADGSVTGFVAQDGRGYWTASGI